MSKGDKILDVKNISMQFNSKGVCVRAVTDVSFPVYEGETIGIVGESGCGKTTLGRCIVRAYEPTAGCVEYTASDGQLLDFLKIDKQTMKKYRKEIQMIFQDPYSSLDPRMTVLDIIKEPILANYPKMPKAEVERRVMDIAAKVGLNTTYLKRYPPRLLRRSAPAHRYRPCTGAEPPRDRMRRGGFRPGRVHPGAGD